MDRRSLNWLLAGSLLLNVGLSWRLITEPTVNSEPWVPHLGSRVPSLMARTLTGEDTTVEFRDAKLPTLIYVFSPKCVWCTKNLDNLQSLVSHAASNYRIIGVSLSEDGLDAYIRDHKLNMEVLREPEAESKKALGMYTTPTTIVISSNATLAGFWRGAYVGEIGHEIERFFNLRLPGLRRLIGEQAR